MLLVLEASSQFGCSKFRVQAFRVGLRVTRAFALDEREVQKPQAWLGPDDLNLRQVQPKGGSDPEQPSRTGIRNFSELHSKMPT